MLYIDLIIKTFIGYKEQCAKKLHFEILSLKAYISFQLLCTTINVSIKQIKAFVITTLIKKRLNTRKDQNKIFSHFLPHRSPPIIHSKIPFICSLVIISMIRKFYTSNLNCANNQMSFKKNEPNEYQRPFSRGPLSALQHVFQ